MTTASLPILLSSSFLLLFLATVGVLCAVSSEMEVGAQSRGTPCGVVLGTRGIFRTFDWA